MSRTFRSREKEIKAKKSYKREKSLAQQFLDEYRENNNRSPLIQL